MKAEPTAGHPPGAFLPPFHCLGYICDVHRSCLVCLVLLDLGIPSAKERVLRYAGSSQGSLKSPALLLSKHSSWSMVCRSIVCLVAISLQISNSQMALIISQIWSCGQRLMLPPLLAGHPSFWILHIHGHVHQCLWWQPCALVTKLAPKSFLHPCYPLSCPWLVVWV